MERLGKLGYLCLDDVVEKSCVLVSYRGHAQPVGVLARWLPRRIASRTWAWVGIVPLPRLRTVRLVMAKNGREVWATSFAVLRTSDDL
ncbi:MAG: hypothetical protein QN189_05345 [Armatimonadota bacterium]|nr:hypothetical protein [Armatimonadota bacterium]